MKADRVAAGRKLESIRAKKRKLHEAFIYDQTIDHDTYVEMKEAIDVDLSAAEYELRATHGSELDLAACL